MPQAAPQEGLTKGKDDPYEMLQRGKDTWVRMDRKREHHGRETKIQSRDQGKYLNLFSSSSWIPTANHFTPVGPGLLPWVFLKDSLHDIPLGRMWGYHVKPQRSTFQKGSAFRLTACSMVHSILVTNHLTYRTLSAFPLFSLSSLYFYCNMF